MITTYQAALDYLYSFINYEAKMPPSPEHARFNLDRLRNLLARCGNPHQQWPSIVIAGTKGKGSTAAMLEAILRASGRRIGLFSSPHLHSWRERIQINRQLIPQADVVRLTARLQTMVAQVPSSFGPPTTFELATALAFIYFSEQQIDLAVLEVGLGGRYDTVNVATPLVSVITPISFDHMPVLGTTLAEIANAKAGIIKTGVPIISATQAPEAAAVIAAEAARNLAPLSWAIPAGLSTADQPIQPYPFVPQPTDLGLLGSYQIENARTVLGAIQLLGQRGISVDLAAIQTGLRTVVWPGRCEILARDPLIIADGAMNEASAIRLNQALQSLPHERRILVLGTSSDKDIAAIARTLVPSAAVLIITRSRHPRAASQETISTAAAPFLKGPMHITPDIPEALDLARQLASPPDLICVTGSLFVVAAAREALGFATEID